jgi:MraZ protein
LFQVHHQSTVTVDDKGRMALPKPIRDDLSAQKVESLVVAYSGEALWALCPADFQDKFAGPIAAGDPFDPLTEYWRNTFVAPAQDVEMDPAGRIRLPTMLRKLAKIDKEVVVHATPLWVEIWDHDRWFERFNQDLSRTDLRRQGLPKPGGPRFSSEGS